MSVVKIYKLTFPNGKSYIGQTRQKFKRRLQRHKYNAENTSIKEYKLPLSNAIRKYGFDNVSKELLEEVSIEEANDRESTYIEKFGTLVEDNGYNCVLDWSDKRKEISEETIRKMSASHKSSERNKRHLEKLHKSRIGVKAANRRKCARYDLSGNLVKTYNCLSDATKDGHLISAISMCCNGKVKTHHNQIWKFL